MEKDKSVIPKGMYCYTVFDTGDVRVCPYWKTDKRHHKHENGYCAYLEKGDWDLNKEPSIPWIVYDGKRENFNPPKSSAELGLMSSLLWDQCKCGDCPKYE